ncbi:MAG: ABC transporter substrate-binding protein [Tepidisphaeraceae bacterium]
MERNFGVKDFVILSVLGVLIVLIVLAMLQFDRQWDEVQNIKHKLDQQAVDLQNIQRTLQSGVAVQNGAANSGSATANSTATGSQARIAAARAMPNFAEGDWMVYGFSSNVPALTPFLGGDANSADVIGNVLETLIDRDPVTLKWQGLLAESWTIDDNTAAWTAYAEKRRAVPLTEDEIKAFDDFPKDAKPEEQKAFVEAKTKEGRTDEVIGREKDCPTAATITFKMRQGPTFSDGTPVTAEDVAFTYNLIQNPQIDAPRERSGLRSIKSVKALPDNKVAFVFRTPFFQALEVAGSTQVMPKHFYEKFSPSEYNQSTGYLMGSGAYQLENPTSWKPGTSIELLRNPRYWGQQSGFSKIVYRQFTNSVAIETSFRNRDIDLMGCPPERYLKLLKDDKILERTQHYEYQASTGGYRYVAWNQAREGKPTKFADKRVRQAMTLLIDQKRIISDVMLNLAVPATGPFNPSSKQCDPSITPWPYDPDKALKLLEEAGWTDKGTGILTNKDGEPFEFTLTYPSGSPNYEKQALLLKDLLAKAKIRMKQDPQEFSVFGERLKHRQFDAISLGWTAGIETDVFQMFHSSQMADGGDDFMSYKNPELDALIEQARRTLDDGERMKIWNKAHRIMYEDQPYTFLFFPKALMFMDKRIANVQQLPLGLSPDREWFVPKDQQRWTK